MFIKHLICLTFLVNLTQAPAHAAEAESRMTVNEKIGLLSQMPNWTFFFEQVLAATYLQEDVAFLKQKFKEANLNLDEKIDVNFKNGTINFPSLKISMKILENGNAVQVGPNIFRLAKGESLEHAFYRFEKTISGKQTTALSMLLPSATADTVVVAGIAAAGVVAVVLGLLSAPVWLTWGAFIVIIGGSIGKIKHLKEVRDYECHKEDDGFDIIMKSGSRLKVNIANQTLLSAQAISPTGKIEPVSGAPADHMARAISATSGRCPKSKAVHEEFRQNIQRLSAQINVQEADASR